MSVNFTFCVEFLVSSPLPLQPVRWSHTVNFSWASNVFFGSPKLHSLFPDPRVGMDVCATHRTRSYGTCCGSGRSTGTSSLHSSMLWTYTPSPQRCAPMHATGAAAWTKKVPASLQAKGWAKPSQLVRGQVCAKISSGGN